MLLVLSFSHKNHNGKTVFNCQCDCGVIKPVVGNYLVIGHAQSCGCVHFGEDLTGKRFGRLLVTGLNHRDAKSDTHWDCLCDCGNTIIVRRAAFTGKKANTNSCGCLKRDVNAAQTIDLVGQTFGRWTVVARAGNTKIGQATWFCCCACGAEGVACGNNLRNGATLSCGCLRDELTTERSTVHGATKGGRWTPEYHSWSSMIQRCTNPKHKNYDDYMGRGITVCERWLNSFADFLADVGLRPSPKHSLGRIDNNSNYEPSNVSWQTLAEQRNNTRASRLITCDGRTQTLAQWSKETSISYATLLTRLDNLKWPVEEALGFKPHVHAARILTDSEQKLHVQARTALNHAVADGLIPKVSTLLCEWCGKPAQTYHHHRGYEPEFQLTVIPLCRQCHGRN
jgi:hypothetical protein